VKSRTMTQHLSLEYNDKIWAILKDPKNSNITSLEINCQVEGLLDSNIIPCIVLFTGFPHLQKIVIYNGTLALWHKGTRENLPSLQSLTMLDPSKHWSENERKHLVHIKDLNLEEHQLHAGLFAKKLNLN
jgi:hypothetical protein